MFLQISEEHGALVHDGAMLSKAYRGPLKEQIRSLFGYLLAIYQDVMSNTAATKRHKVSKQKQHLGFKLQNF